MKRQLALLACAALALCLLSSQFDSQYRRVMSDPSTVADLFLSCPYIDIGPSTQADDHGRILYSDRELSGVDRQEAYERKKALLNGGDGAEGKPSLLVVDEKDGYMRVALGKTDLTLVYYTVPGGRIPAFRLKTAEWEGDGAPWKTVWEFYNLDEGSWIRLDTADLPNEFSILPDDFPQSLLGHDLTDKDRWNINLPSYAAQRRFWDIWLPQKGTTAYLIPIDFWANGEGDPAIGLDAETAKASPRLADYQSWFNRSFMFSDGTRRALELKWDQRAKRFNSGKAVTWDIAKARVRAEY
jgi:hypothetical protein